MAVAVVVLLVTGAAAVAVADFGGDDHPDEWDPRVADIARFVERARDLEFRHPVRVEFMPDDEFREEVTADEEDLTEEDRREIEAVAGAFRALGLVEGELDLFAQTNVLHGEGVLAYYDHDEDAVFVRGTEVTPRLRATLAHELVHALQDQHFDLSRLDEDDATDGEYAAFQALVEGDAQLVEFEFVSDFDEADFEQYREELEAEETEAGAIEEVPPILRTFFGAPYVLGEALVGVLLAEGGNDTVDDAFREPPTSEEHLIDPFTYLGDDEPAEVDVPELREGEEEVDSGDFGAITWYLALAERLDPRQALAAVDGWGGDAYVLYRAEERTCIRLAFVGDTAEDAGEMGEALDAWAAAVPAIGAEVRRSEDRVDLQSCDPGAEADLDVQGLSADAMVLPVVRAEVGAELVGAGLPRRDARCVGRELLAAMSLDQVRSLGELVYGAEVDDPTLAALFDEAVSRCGIPVPG